jgi:hypothetical protein
MFLHKPLQPMEFQSAEAMAVLQSYRLQPEFGDLIVTLHMDMGWLIAIPGIEKESIRTNAQDRRHRAAPSERDQ